MRKPVFNLFWLLFCVCTIWGCGVRPGEKTPENQTQEMLSYEIGDAEVTITYCNEAADGDLEIPAEIAGLPVTSIGDYAFRECTSLSSITIGDSVTSIGKLAFFSCWNLTSVTIPETFHSEAEASRLGLDKLWPDGFLLPDSTSN